MGDAYFPFPFKWGRSESTDLVSYVRWFCGYKALTLTGEADDEWDRSAHDIRRLAKRQRDVTFHAGPLRSCPGDMIRVDVAKTFKTSGTPPGVNPRDVTGLDFRCLAFMLSQPEVARAVRAIVTVVEVGGETTREVAVLCEHGKHRSVAVAMIMIALVYPQARLALHNERALVDARTYLDSAKHSAASNRASALD